MAKKALKTDELKEIEALLPAIDENLENTGGKYSQIAVNTAKIRLRGMADDLRRMAHHLSLYAQTKPGPDETKAD